MIAPLRDHRVEVAVLHLLTRGDMLREEIREAIGRRFRSSALVRLELDRQVLQLEGRRFKITGFGELRLRQEAASVPAGGRP